MNALSSAQQFLQLTGRSQLIPESQLAVILRQASADLQVPADGISASGIADWLVPRNCCRANTAASFWVLINSTANWLAAE
jgi:hypothetical protein